MSARRHTWLVVSVLILAAALSAPAAEGGDRKLVAQVDEPFEINGEVFPASRLAVREVRDFSPIATLGEILVDGRSLGLVYFQQRNNLVATRDELVFHRAADGHLVLHAVAREGQPTRELFRFEPGVNGGRWLRADEPQPRTGDLNAMLLDRY